MSVASRNAPPSSARIVEVADEETDVVLTVKFALVAPAGIVTLAGTVTAGALKLVKLTTVGDDCAALMLTVPCDELPPVTLVGFKVSADKTAVFCGGGITVTTALCTESPKYAAIVTSVGAETGLAMKLT